MTVFIRISPLVLAVAVVAIVMGHMGGISVAIAAVGIGLGVALPSAVIGAVALLWHRLRQETPSPQAFSKVIRVSPERGELAGPPRAIAPVRLDGGQLEELAEILRRKAEQ